MHSARPRAALLIALALPLSAAPGPGCRATDAPAPTSAAASRDAERHAMVRDQVEGRGVRDRRVLDALRTVPRHRFVPESFRDLAYADMPLPIGRGQTISQPYIVAFMAEALRLRGGERILEIGSGSGYALAVLSRLGAEVHGIELEQELHDRSAATLRALGYPNVHTRAGDGFRGWPEKAPFDAILVSCAVEELPAPLWDQLAEGGRVVFPAGPDGALQHLVVRTKTSGGPREERLLPVRFVPMRRAAQPRRRRAATAWIGRPPARRGRPRPPAAHFVVPGFSGVFSRRRPRMSSPSG